MPVKFGAIPRSGRGVTHIHTFAKRGSKRVLFPDLPAGDNRTGDKITPKGAPN